MYERTDSQLLPAPERTISLAPDLPPIPERLLLAHARGDVLFLCGAGVSMQAGLPDFRQLVRGVYKSLDPPVYEILPGSPGDPHHPPALDCSRLDDRQKAEIKRFNAREFDVVLGMLERRLDRDDTKRQQRQSGLSSCSFANYAKNGSSAAPKSGRGRSDSGCDSRATALHIRHPSIVPSFDSRTAAPPPQS